MSKAEIITFEPQGRHNRHFDTASSRILNGGTWKKQRTIVLLPADKLMASKVALSHCNLIFPPNNGVFRMLCQGMEVGDAYSRGIEMILSHPELSEWEYLLTIEADNVPPPDGLLLLIESMQKHKEYCCIGGLYWTKGEGGVPQIWGDPQDPILNFRPQIPLPEQVQECNGTGMGFNLWRISTFKDKKLRKPWFVTQASAKGVGTQDLYFWSDARKYGYRCAIDTRCKVGHYDVNSDIVW